MDPQLICPSCKTSISPEWFFCPNCGKKLKEKLLSTGIGRQLFVYLMSILLPPSGIIYGVRYFKQGDTKSLIVGFIAMALTVVVVVYTIVFTISFINSYTQLINKVGNPDNFTAPSTNNLQPIY